MIGGSSACLRYLLCFTEDCYSKSVVFWSNWNNRETGKKE